MTAEPPPELEVFAAREMPRVVGTLALYCGDRDVAEELAQEALVRICRDWERVRGMDHPARGCTESRSTSPTPTIADGRPPGAHAVRSRHTRLSRPCCPTPPTP